MSKDVERGLFGLSGTGNTVLLLTIVFAAIIGTYFSVSTYFTQISIYADKELAKLKAVASTGAMMIDGDDLTYLLRNYGEIDAIQTNEMDSIYSSVQKTLRQIREINDLETTVYTLVYSPKLDKFCFMVNSEENPFWLHDYRDYPEKLLEDYDRGGVLPPYRSPNGYWLSAFYPIKNSQGLTAGILHVDQRFDVFMDQATEPVVRSIIISLFVIVLLTIGLALNVRSQLRKEAMMSDRSEKLEQLRKELIANVSHDLRTPLSVLRGYLETIWMKADKSGNGDLSTYANTALQSVDKLSKIIEELFELSKMESGDRRVELQLEDALVLLKEKADSFRQSAREKGMQLITDFPEENLVALMDVAMIERVLDNLISNAIRYSNAGDTITVGAYKLRENPQMVRFFVRDTGPGIPPEKASKIFERSYSVDRHAGGSGLGLYIARSIVRLHGGELIVKTEVGKGSSFEFDLKTYA